MTNQEFREIISRLDQIDLKLEKLGTPLTTESIPRVKASNDNAMNKSPLVKLAEKTKISEDGLKTIVEFNNEEFKLLISFNENVESKKQVRASYIILAVNYISYGNEQILSSDLKKRLKWLGIKSLEKLSVNLKNEEGLIEAVGKNGSTKFSYKITYPGLQEAIKYMQEAINNKINGNQNE